MPTLAELGKPAAWYRRVAASPAPHPDPNGSVSARIG
jgi:hypothetical protein